MGISSLEKSKIEYNQPILDLAYHVYIVMNIHSMSSYFMVQDPEDFSGYVSLGPQTSVSLETSSNFPRMTTLATVAPKL